MKLQDALKVTSIVVYRFSGGAIMMKDNTRVDNGFSVEFNPSPTAQISQTPTTEIPSIKPVTVETYYTYAELQEALTLLGVPTDADTWELVFYNLSLQTDA